MLKTINIIEMLDGKITQVISYPLTSLDAAQRMFIRLYKEHQDPSYIEGHTKYEGDRLTMMDVNQLMCDGYDDDNGYQLLFQRSSQPPPNPEILNIGEVHSISFEGSKVSVQPIQIIKSQELGFRLDFLNGKNNERTRLFVTRKAGAALASLLLFQNALLQPK